MQNLLAVLYGLVFGIANIIPGVSGGTMLVTFGCFDKVCGALSLNFKEIKKNLVFLIFFGIGALVGIVGFSFVVTFLFDNFPVPTYMFFIGLILGSVPLIYRNATAKEKLRPVCLIPFVLSLALVVGLGILEQNAPADYLLKSDIVENTVSVEFTNNSGRVMENLYFQPEDGKLLSVSGNSVRLEYRPGLSDTIKGWFGKAADTSPNTVVVDIPLDPGKAIQFTAAMEGTPLLEPEYETPMSVGFFLTLLLASVIASIAMIIPGVSGSFVMVLLGTYATVISAISNLKLLTLLPVLIGVIVGLVFGARLIRYLLKKFRLIVFSGILGLVIGSVYAILPTGFGLNIPTLIGVFTLIAGGAVSLLVGKHTPTDEE